MSLLLLFGGQSASGGSAVFSSIVRKHVGIVAAGSINPPSGLNG